MSRRVAVRKHRVRRRDPSGRTQPTFNEASKYLHGQPHTQSEHRPRGACFCCSRKAGPDIFEVISQEESMVPMHPKWNSGDDETLLDLYAEEFGWQCCRIQCKNEDAEYQQVRKGQWKEGTGDIRKRLTTSQRWDILG